MHACRTVCAHSVKEFFKPGLRILSDSNPALKLTCTASLRSASTKQPLKDQADFTALSLSDSQRRTIYALSTPPGKAGIGVVRISGPGSANVWTRMVQRVKPSVSDAPDPLKM